MRARTITIHNVQDETFAALAPRLPELIERWAAIEATGDRYAMGREAASLCRIYRAEWNRHYDRVRVLAWEEVESTSTTYRRASSGGMVCDSAEPRNFSPTSWENGEQGWKIMVIQAARGFDVDLSTTRPTFSDFRRWGWFRKHDETIAP